VLVLGWNGLGPPWFGPMEPIEVAELPPAETEVDEAALDAKFEADAEDEAEDKAKAKADLLRELTAALNDELPELGETDLDSLEAP
jgi:hypothetical protein